MNLVKKLQDIANLNGWKFVHSVKFGLNLFDDVVSDLQTILMIESPLDFKELLDDNGTSVGTQVSAVVYLLKSSNLDEPVGNETGYELDAGRYSKNIMALIKDKGKLLTGLSNCECKLVDFSYKDAYNILDYNLDGLIINLNYEC